MAKIVLIVAVAFGLVSCVNNPERYEVNTVPYADKLAVDPVIMVNPEDVKPIGGSPKFQFNLTGKVRTDNGEYTLSPDGVEGEVVVDLTTDRLK